ncbi:hypothetical protein L615_000800000850 [Nocardioides sp. J9]|uniref:hypothetical protein n=1 Tax=Nocardioides sp. J9 TaxID=935844 RepID=UPI0011A83EC4|nr:hypothetical protein [Nocardioides sp. J9]TWG91575.1 hypothetical protein L615_000800000850 [Nocardioides sp. J9]
MSLALVAPGTPAHPEPSAERAAARHPWLGYYPAVGVKCTYEVRDFIGDEVDTEWSRVAEKTSRRIVIRSSEGPSRYTLLRGGKVGLRETTSDREDGYSYRMVMRMTYPSPSGMRRGLAEKGTLTLSMTLPAREARVLLKSGRTMTTKATFRIKGLGQRQIPLADDDRTQVRAVGMKLAFASMTISNVKKRYVAAFKSEFRPTLKSFNRTSWIAPRRGVVLLKALDDDGLEETTRQIGCR